MLPGCRVIVDDRRVSREELKAAFEERDAALKAISQLLEAHEGKLKALEESKK